MNCEDADCYAEAFRDSELEPTKALEFEEHLEACPRCRVRCEEAGVLDAAIRRRINEGERTEWLWRRIEASVATVGGDRVPSWGRGSVWRELFWPGPRWYLALMSIWVVVLVLRLQLDLPARDHAGRSPKPNITVVGWLEHREAMRQMLDLPASALPPLREQAAPSPRSAAPNPLSQA